MFSKEWRTWCIDNRLSSIFNKTPKSLSLGIFLVSELVQMRFIKSNKRTKFDCATWVSIFFHSSIRLTFLNNSAIKKEEVFLFFFLVLNSLFRDGLSAQLKPVKWRQSIQDTADVSGCLVRLFIEVLLQAFQPWLPTLFSGYCFFPSPEARMKEERPWELGCTGCLNFLLVFFFIYFPGAA